jgi:uncharacterized damage-inducible protein DinB
VITTAWAQTMAAYNRWQNETVITAVDQLDDAARRSDQGLYFGSITGTLNHLLWADRLWLHRFAGTTRPAAASIAQSTGLYDDWATLTSERRCTDQAIVDWAETLEQGWLEGDLTWYSGAAGRDITSPRAVLVTHLFNHQTHHRGQVHAALTRAGLGTAPTDLPFMPPLDRAPLAI